MARLKGRKTKAAAPRPQRTTTMSFTSDDLGNLARLVAHGRVLLQVNHPVVARLKAALTRMGVPVPQGL